MEVESDVEDQSHLVLVSIINFLLVSINLIF